MTRNIFYAIRTQLKCVFDQEDTEDQTENKTIANKILLGCLEQDRHQAICLDEMIISFSGRQYCPNK